jgi:hypothetical protein
MKYLLLILSFVAFTGTSALAQKLYSTTGGELLFSLADVSYANEEAHDVLRFSPVINLYKYWHYDFSEHIGMIAGFGTHNVGFIVDVPIALVGQHPDLGYKGDMRKKFRNYTVGIPVGLKIGLMEKFYLYGGYEIEFPYAYKEKTIEDGEKVRTYSKWFSNQSPSYYNSFFVGVQLPRGTSIKFQYYISEFFNQGYVQNTANWTEARNFYPTSANMFHFSISKTMFRGKSFMYYDKTPPSGAGDRMSMR